MSWHYLQEGAVASWEESSLVGAPSALLRLIPTAEACCLADNATECCPSSLSGTTCGHSTAAPGADMSMSSAEAFHARTSVAPEKARESQVSVPAFGESLRELFARYDHDTSSWKTRQCSLLGDSDEFLATWPRWGSMQNGAAYLRKVAALGMSAFGYGLLLPTLTVHGNYNRKGMSKTSGDELRTALVNRQLPTLCKRDSRTLAGSQPPKRAPKSGLPLAWLIGKDLSQAERRGGSLNPTWCEWFVGVPMGWTELQPLEISKFQSWLRQHGVF